jgi:hypothetical protein
MPDPVGGPPSITLLQAVLTFSGALLAPVIGTIAGLLSRSSLQRKQQEAEYKIKRLDLIDRAIGVGKTLSNSLGINIDISLAQGEYIRILRSIPESKPPPEQDLLPFERHSFPVRLLILPRPTSISGWIASTLFYMYLISAPLFLLTATSLSEFETRSPYSLEFSERRNKVLRTQMIIMPAGSLLIAAGARFWAIRVAKATIRRDRERFQRETNPEATTPLVHNS